MHSTPTIRFTRRRLPHWEVESARYFITVRCADSLPLAAVKRLQELHQTQCRIEPNSQEFADAQRQLFRTLEKYLDAGFGACPLRDPAAAAVVIDELAALAEWNIAVPHFSIMPNHWHALLVPVDSQSHSLSAIMKRLKGRTARRIRRVIGGHGPFWQGEWFDRWVRDATEWEKFGAYIHNNPVKAGLVRTWQEHPFTK